MAVAAPDIEERYKAPPTGQPGRPSEVITSAPATSEVLPVDRTWLNRYTAQIRQIPSSIDDAMRDFGLDIYRKMMQHPQVSASIETLILTTFAQQLDIQPGVDEGEDGYEESVQYAEFCRANIRRLGVSLLQTLYELDEGATVEGHRYAEIVYEVGVLNQNDGPQLLLKALKPRPNDAYVQFVDAYNNLLCLVSKYKALSYLAFGALKLSDIPEQDRIPPSKFLRRVNQPQNGDPNGNSDLRDVFGPWWDDIQLKPAWLAFLSTCAQPSVGYEQREGGPATWQWTDYSTNPLGEAKSVQAHVKGLEIASSAHNGSSYFVPDGDKLTFLEPSTSGETFHGAFDRNTENIVKGVLDATLQTEQGDHASRAQATVHRSMSSLKPRFHKFLNAHMLETQLFDQMLRLNYQSYTSDKCPKAQLGQAEQWDINTLGQVINQMAMAGILVPSLLESSHIKGGIGQGSREDYEQYRKWWYATHPAELPQEQPTQSEAA